MYLVYKASIQRKLHHQTRRATTPEISMWGSFIIGFKGLSLGRVQMEHPPHE